MKPFFLAGMILCFTSLYAQTEPPDTANKYVQLNEVVISANKFQEKKRNIAQKIDIISRAYISRMNAQNTGDLLMSTGNVFVQKSQQGGSSPVIRGFEASRVLLVVDGVRLNNLIYRSGHLQNAITIDQNMLETMEVLYGPASTLYGSDALGGVIHFRSKRPLLSAESSTKVSGLTFVRYSTANDEKTTHVQVNTGGKRFSWLHASTFSSFGDTKMGSNFPNDHPDFGRRKEYITSVNGIDSILPNSDDLIQKFSGYKQWDITEKFLWKPGEQTTHLLNFQFSNSTDVPRYDRLQDIRNGNLRYAEWYYGPQFRILTSYELESSLPGIFDRVRMNVNYQDVRESRHTREYQRYDRLDSRYEEVKVAGVVVDGFRKWKQHEITIGADAQFNALTSTAERRDIRTGAVSRLDTRYPDGKNRMNYFGLFAQHLLKINEGKIILNDGIRLQTVRLFSSIIDNSFFQLPYSEIRQNNSSVTGNIGFVYTPVPASKISVNVASGFRVPNVDDLSKIFESSTASRQVVIPNPDIKPEYTYNIDLGFSQVFAEKIKIEISGFHTWFRNAIIKAPFQLNGEDSILYYGVLSQVLAGQNKNKAVLYGVSGGLSADFTKHWSFLTTINYTRGYFNTAPGELASVYRKQPNGSYLLVQEVGPNKPLDHIPPVFGKTSIQYRAHGFTTEVYMLYNGTKALDQYNADGEDNAQYATPSGMPGWFTMNWRASVTLSKFLQLQVAIENILDRNYRHFGSGFSAPGRNFVFAGRVIF